MKTKTFSILFALVMILSLSVGVFAQDFDETWDENTVLTVFNDLNMVFPDLFADIDSNFLWSESGPRPFTSNFPTTTGSDGKETPIAKAPLADGYYSLDEDGNVIVDENGIPVSSGYYEGKFTFDPCGDGLIKFETTLFKMDMEDARNQGYYYITVMQILLIFVISLLNFSCLTPDCHLILVSKNAKPAAAKAAVLLPSKEMAISSQLN